MLSNRDHIRKFISGIFLIALLFVHSIKLLHTHPGNNVFSGQITKAAGIDKIISGKAAHGSPDCEICNYQVTQDADDLFCIAACDVKKEYIIHTAPFISYSIPVFFSSSESRGPPAIIL